MSSTCVFTQMPYVSIANILLYNVFYFYPSHFIHGLITIYQQLGGQTWMVTTMY